MLTEHLLYARNLSACWRQVSAQEEGGPIDAHLLAFSAAFQGLGLSFYVRRSGCPAECSSDLKLFYELHNMRIEGLLGSENDPISGVWAMVRMLWDCSSKAFPPSYPSARGL